MNPPAPGRTGLVVGLDIGGTKTLGVLLGPDDTVLGSVRLPTTLGVDGVLATAARAVRALIEDHATWPGALVGVGVGIPGVVDPEAGTVAHAVHLGLPEGLTPLAKLLSVALDGVPVQVENDLNAAALGAAHAVRDPGAPAYPADLAFLALGTGLAAGFVLDGRLRRGTFGAAGEIGHLPFVADGPVCACGQRGCLELYASGAALDARWPSPGDIPPPAALFAAAAARDPAAVAVRDDFVRAVATAVRIIVLTTDVGYVVLGGGVSELGAPLRDAVVEALDEQASGSAFLSSMRIGERIRLTPPGVPVAAIGAALLCQQLAG